MGVSLTIVGQEAADKKNIKKKLSVENRGS